MNKTVERVTLHTHQMRKYILLLITVENKGEAVGVAFKTEPRERDKVNRRREAFFLRIVDTFDRLCRQTYEFSHYVR